MFSLAITAFPLLRSLAQDGVNALHIASFKGRAKIVRYLCENKQINANIQDTVKTQFVVAYNFVVFFPLRME